MKNLLFLALAVLLTGLSPLGAQTAKSVKVKIQSYSSKKCARENCCVELSLNWPVLSGGNLQVVRAINDSIRSVVYMAAEADPAHALPVALDSAAASAFAMLKEQLTNMDGYDMGYSYDLKSKVLLNNGRFVSLEMNNYTFTGGAHGNYFTLLQTYDMNTGAIVPLHAIIRDTAALRPMLEKEFLRQKTQPGEPAPTLSDILFEDFKELPMPLDYALTPRGVRFMYNPYEVAAYVFGQTDITLSWTQLGALADRKKWGL